MPIGAQPLHENQQPWMHAMTELTFQCGAGQPGCARPEVLIAHMYSSFQDIVALRRCCSPSWSSPWLGAYWTFLMPKAERSTTHLTALRHTASHDAPPLSVEVTLLNSSGFRCSFLTHRKAFLENYVMTNKVKVGTGSFIPETRPRVALFH